jgi:hypothetical protein
MTIPIDRLPVDADECFERLGLFRFGEHYEYFSQERFLALNVITLAAGFASVFGLAYLIPMLVGSLALLIRRYWKWLNA